MMQRKPKSKFQPTQPTLRVDSQLAWRQGDNAVILPIVYEPAEPELPKSNPDAAIVTINWPLKVPSRKLKTSIISIEGLSSEEDRKESRIGERAHHQNQNTSDERIACGRALEC